MNDLLILLSLKNFRNSIVNFVPSVPELFSTLLYQGDIIEISCAIADTSLI